MKPRARAMRAAVGAVIALTYFGGSATVPSALKANDEGVNPQGWTGFITSTSTFEHESQGQTATVVTTATWHFNGPDAAVTVDVDHIQTLRPSPEDRCEYTVVGTANYTGLRASPEVALRILNSAGLIPRQGVAGRYQFDSGPSVVPFDVTLEYASPNPLCPPDTETGQMFGVYTHIPRLRWFDAPAGWTVLQGRWSDVSSPGSTYTARWELRPSNQPPAPEAAFTARWEGSQGSTTEYFSAVSSEFEEGATFEWQFGDGTTGTGVEPVHAYPTAGAYSVTLKVTNPDGASDVVTRGIVVNAPWVYAPVVRFHPDEKFLAGGAGAYILESSLNYQHGEAPGTDKDCGSHVVAEKKKVDLTRLGDASTNPYSHAIGGYSLVNGKLKCGDTNFLAYADDYTKPDSDKGTKTNPAWEGFFLNHLQGNVNGSLTAPAYYEYDEDANEIRYWFFYPHNRWYWKLPGVVSILQVHQSDWEGIVVKLDADDAATSVAFRQHHCSLEEYSFADLRESGGVHAGTRPVVLAALGGHASYPYEPGFDPHQRVACPAGDVFGIDPGLFPIDIDWDKLSLYDAVGADKTWNTRFDLRDAETQPWYGFGGAWGWGDPGASFYEKTQTVVIGAWGATGPGEKE